MAKIILQHDKDQDVKISNRVTITDFTNRKDQVDAALKTLSDNLSKSFNDLTAGYTDYTDTEIETLKNSLTTAMKAADDALAKAQKDFKDGDFDSLVALVGTINGDSATDGSFRKALSDLIGSAPEVLDTLGEIADKFKDLGDIWEAFLQRITDNESNISALGQRVTAEVKTLNTTINDLTKAHSDRMGEREEALSQSQTALSSEINQVKNDLLAKIEGTRPEIMVESGTIDADGKFLLSHNPLGTITDDLCYVTKEEDGAIIYLNRYSLTPDANDADGKTFIVSNVTDEDKDEIYGTGCKAKVSYIYNPGL